MTTEQLTLIHRVLWCPACEQEVEAATDSHVLLCLVDDGHSLVEEQLS